jgi:excisionase family DNA binding protein
MSPSDPLLSDYYSHEEAANELDVTRRTLDRWERLGEGPPITRIGRRILYRRSSLQAWLGARERKPHEHR